MIQVQSLSFAYPKQPTFIKNLSFHLNPGEILGFLGPSGAGKSTLQKILTGILREYSGSVQVQGREVRSSGNEIYEKIGVAFEFPNLYGKFTGLENLNFFGSLYKEQPQDAMGLLKRVGLAGDATKKVSSYSKGMKMRLAFVRALLHNPDLLFLDEPTSGLDPRNARTMKEIILEQKRQGKSVILTTHNMHDAEELCDRVAFILDGQIVALDTPHALRIRKGGIEVRYTYREKDQEFEVYAPLADLHHNQAFMTRLQTGSLTSIASKEPTLEDVFIELTGRCLK